MVVDAHPAGSDRIRQFRCDLFGVFDLNPRFFVWPYPHDRYNPSRLSFSDPDLYKYPLFRHAKAVTKYAVRVRCQRHENKQQ